MTRLAVWDKAVIVEGVHPDVTRKDIYGNLIDRNAYGETSARGWEIDHIVPVSKGGTADLVNIQPLHWKNNRAKGNNFPFLPARPTLAETMATSAAIASAPKPSLAEILATYTPAAATAKRTLAYRLAPLSVKLNRTLG